MKHPTLRLAALAVFSATGLVGWKLAEPSREKAATERMTEVTGKREQRSVRQARSLAAEQARSRIAAIRLAGSSEERMRATVDLAYSLSPDEFAAWIDGGWFTLRGGAELTLFTKIVMERWKLEDEDGLMVWMMKSGNGRHDVLTDLAQRNPDRVLEYFRENPSPQREMEALWEIAKHQPDLVLARFRELVNQGRWREIQGYSDGLMRNLAEKDPAKLAAAMEDLPAAARQQAEIALSRERLKKSFSEEIRTLWDRPDGWRIFSGYLHSVEDAGDKLLAELGNIPASWRGEMASNPYYFIRRENAEQWMNADLATAGFSAREIGNLSERALAFIARDNPAEAFRRMGELDLGERQRRNFISNLIGNANDEEKAREMTALLSSEEDRNWSNDIIAQRFAQRNPETKVESPADWLASAAESDPAQGGISYEMRSMLENWDEGKMNELSAGFRSLDAEKKALVAETVVNSIGHYGNTSNAFAGDALRYLMENPKPEAEGARSGGHNSLLQRAGSYVVNLSTRDPAAASEWTASLPPGEPKAWTQWNLLNNWRQYDPKAADQWEKSLPAGERSRLQEIARKKGK